MSTKVCFRCNTEKPITEFYSHPKMADGHIGKCKSCNKDDVRARYALTRRERQDYDARRNATSERKNQRKAILKRYSANNPEKARARQAVGNAIRGGRLFRQPCSVCGELKVHAHHEDYSKPLDIIWLCQPCHRKHHGQHPRGHF